MKAGLIGKSEDDQRKILRHEITFQRSTHPNDALARKELYLINKQEVSTMIYNLGILLASDCTREEHNGEVFLPTEEEVLLTLTSSETSEISTIIAEELLTVEQGNDMLFTNTLCCVVWEESNGKLNWFLGYVLDISVSVKIEHLAKVSKSIDTSWQYPKNVNDVQDAERDQILPITVVADWDYTDPENFILTVKNAEDIAKCFRDFVDTN